MSVYCVVYINLIKSALLKQMYRSTLFLIVLHKLEKRAQLYNTMPCFYRFALIFQNHLWEYVIKKGIMIWSITSFNKGSAYCITCRHHVMFYIMPKVQQQQIRSRWFCCCCLFCFVFVFAVRNSKDELILNIILLNIINFYVNHCTERVGLFF